MCEGGCGSLHDDGQRGNAEEDIYAEHWIDLELAATRNHFLLRIHEPLVDGEQQNKQVKFPQDGVEGKALADTTARNYIDGIAKRSGGSCARTVRVVTNLHIGFLAAWGYVAELNALVRYHTLCMNVYRPINHHHQRYCHHRCHCYHISHHHNCCSDQAAYAV